MDGNFKFILNFNDKFSHTIVDQNTKLIVIKEFASKAFNIKNISLIYLNHDLRNYEDLIISKIFKNKLINIVVNELSTNQINQPEEYLICECDKPVTFTCRECFKYVCIECIEAYHKTHIKLKLETNIEQTICNYESLISYNMDYNLKNLSLNEKSEINFNNRYEIITNKVNEIFKNIQNILNIKSYINSIDIAEIQIGMKQRNIVNINNLYTRNYSKEEYDTCLKDLSSSDETTISFMKNIKFLNKFKNIEENFIEFQTNIEKSIDEFINFQNVLYESLNFSLEDKSQDKPKFAKNFDLSDFKFVKLNDFLKNSNSLKKSPSKLLKSKIIDPVAIAENNKNTKLNKIDHQRKILFINKSIKNYNKNSNNNSISIQDSKENNGVTTKKYFHSNIYFKDINEILNNPEDKQLYNNWSNNKKILSKRGSKLDNNIMKKSKKSDNDDLFIINPLDIKKPNNEGRNNHIIKNMLISNKISIRSEENLMRFLEKEEPIGNCNSNTLRDENYIRNKINSDTNMKNIQCNLPVLKSDELIYLNDDNIICNISVQENFSYEDIKYESLSEAQDKKFLPVLNKLYKTNFPSDREETEKVKSILKSNNSTENNEKKLKILDKPIFHSVNIYEPVIQNVKRKIKLKNNSKK